MFAVQELLAKNDERGQPCIFYALQSRSQKALVCLLRRVEDSNCVIAENGESVLHVAAKMGDIGILTLDYLSYQSSSRWSSVGTVVNYVPEKDISNVVVQCNYYSIPPQAVLVFI